MLHFWQVSEIAGVHSELWCSAKWPQARPADSSSIFSSTASERQDRPFPEMRRGLASLDTHKCDESLPPTPAVHAQRQTRDATLNGRIIQDARSGFNNFKPAEAIKRLRHAGRWTLLFSLSSLRPAVADLAAGRQNCGCSSVVEHLLAKEDVASSSLVTRSSLGLESSAKQDL